MIFILSSCLTSTMADGTLTKVIPSAVLCLVIKLLEDKLSLSRTAPTFISFSVPWLLPEFFNAS